LIIATGPIADAKPLGIAVAPIVALAVAGADEADDARVETIAGTTRRSR
jgi:hypothetical protein